MQTMVVGRTCPTVSPRLSISILILVLLLLLVFPPSVSHGTSWRTGENPDTAPYSSEIIDDGNPNTKTARDLVVGGYSSALVDVEGSARQVPTGPDPLHHRRKPVSP